MQLSPKEYQIANNTVKLINDDCFNVLKNIDDNSIDLVIADPPYKLERPNQSGLKYLFDLKNINIDEPEWDYMNLDQYTDFTEKWLIEAIRVLKPTGNMFISGTYHNIGIINYLCQKNKFMIINEICWYKRNAIPNLACRRLTASFETILWIAKTKNYVFNYGDMKDGSFSEDTLKRQGRQMRNVWDIPTNGHESVGFYTQKPVKLYERMIRAGCPQNARSYILDPFAGSGTSAIAACNRGVNAILIEKEPDYVNLIDRRIQEYNISKPSTDNIFYFGSERRKRQETYDGPDKRKIA